MRPDYRTTLYWNPSVTTDDAGKVRVQFYSSDVSKHYLLTIEGVMANGRPVSWQGLINI